MLKGISLVILGLFVISITGLPYRMQIALANSLQVGRNQDPTVWACVGCQDANKPIRTHIVQEPVVDVKAIFSVYQEYTVLAFRYTATLKNVWQDLLWAIQVQDQHAPKGCKVQKQYEKMWNSIREYVFKDLENSPKTNRLIISGISLGGGLASLAYVDIHNSKLFQNYQIITYGSPRVGNKKWAKWFDTITNTDRIFIKGDPFSVLPICFTPICTYRQTGSAIVCNKRKEICKKKCSSGTDLFAELQDFDIEETTLMMKQALSIGLTEDQNVDGIIDHVVGYKKLYNYTFIDC